MRHKVKHVHFVGRGGAGATWEQGSVTFWVTGCDRPGAALAADGAVLIEAGCPR